PLLPSLFPYTTRFRSYSSVWPFWRPKPLTSVTVMPCTPIADRPSRTSSSLNGLMIAVISFMRVSRSEGLADRQHDGALAEVAVERVAVALADAAFGIVADVCQAPGQADLLLRRADLPVGVRAVAVRVDLLVADVRGQRDAAADVEVAAQVEVARALAVGEPEQVGQRVRVLQRQHLPAERAVDLERVGRVEARRVLAREVCVQQTDVVADVADGTLVAAAEIPSGAAADRAGSGIGEPAHVRHPGAGVQSAGVRI